MNLRIFGKNTLIYGFSNSAIRFTGFLLVPLYTRCLSIEDYGMLATLLVTVQVMTIFMRMEMQAAIIRFCGEFESKGLVGQLLGSSIMVNLIGCVVVIGFSTTVLPGLFERLIQGRPVLKYLALCSCAAAFQSLCVHVMSYYRARNEALKYALFALSSATLVLFLTTLLLVIFHLGIEGVLTAQAASFAIVAIIISFKLFKRLKPAASFSVVRQLFGFSSPLIFSGSAWFVMSSADRYFLVHFTGLEVVGIYHVGYMIASVLVLLVVMPFQMAYGPFTFAHLSAPCIKEKLGQLFWYLVSAILLVGLGIALCAPFVLRIMVPPQYGEAYLVSLCILPVGAMMGIYYWSSALIHIVKRTYIIGAIMTFAAGLNLMLNYLLIPRLGWQGAALATNISFLLATTGVFVLGMRLFPVPLVSEARVGAKAIATSIGTCIKCLRARLAIYETKSSMERSVEK